MASNSFGNIFKITTWGESHGEAIGVVIDGCPAGLFLSEEDLYSALIKRAPGNSPWVSQRKEPDKPRILSGVFKGETTGTPICILIPNVDTRSEDYKAVENIYRPGHANFTYLEKYGIFDFRGGGRASARETACRVAAGAVAQKLLDHYKIEIIAYLTAMGDSEVHMDIADYNAWKMNIDESPLFCPDASATQKMIHLLEDVQSRGDSLGGVVEVIAVGLPVGLGDPVYEKLEANLAKAMLSLPASKGIEFGDGFGACRMLGSQCNDPFIYKEGRVETQSNHAGGTLGGISTGMPLKLRVAFKPPSSIRIPQQSLSIDKKEAQTLNAKEGRHDPCVTIRAVPVVKAMMQLVLADSLLMQRSSQVSYA